jgi:hypothetical protein
MMMRMLSHWQEMVVVRPRGGSTGSCPVQNFKNGSGRAWIVVGVTRPRSKHDRITHLVGVTE